MANIKSQKKRIITNEKARMRNRAVRSELKTAVRVVREAVEAQDGAKAYAAALDACRLLDRAASKGVIHKRQAANRKSGVMKLANTIVTPEIIAKRIHLLCHFNSSCLGTSSAQSIYLHFSSPPVNRN